MAKARCIQVHFGTPWYTEQSKTTWNKIYCTASRLYVVVMNTLQVAQSLALNIRILEYAQNFTWLIQRHSLRFTLNQYLICLSESWTTAGRGLWWAHAWPVSSTSKFIACQRAEYNYVYRCFTYGNGHWTRKILQKWTLELIQTWALKYMKYTLDTKCNLSDPYRHVKPVISC